MAVERFDQHGQGVSTTPTTACPPEWMWTCCGRNPGLSRSRCCKSAGKVARRYHRRILAFVGDTNWRAQDRKP